MKVPQSSASTSRRDRSEGRNHAIVIGGSMAGMLAARVLSEKFDGVTLLERDVYPETIDHRKGVPQSHHLHALLARGLQIIEELFPGIHKELVDAGASELESGVDVAWLTPAGWGKTYSSNLKVVSFSRPFLDWHIRRRLAQVENVRIVAGCEVAALLPNAEGDGVSGVSLRTQDGRMVGVPLLVSNNGEHFLKADLVVDASGRHSHAPHWLAALGYQPPRETIVNAFLGYSTRTYKSLSVDNPPWKAVFLQAAPPERTRAGLLFPIDGNRWTLTLCGGDRDYPPSDEQGYLRFAESLPDSVIANAIRRAEPDTPIRTFRNTQNRLRHYEEMPRLPGNFVLLGDSVCAFNPVYGQGMTIASMGAIELRRSLVQRGRRPLGPDFARKFQKRLAKINTLPWALATGEDCRYRGTEGASRTWKAKFMHAYIDGVVALTTHDADARDIWLRVFQMLLPPSRLFRPGILFKVLRQAVMSLSLPKTSRPLIASQPHLANSSGDCSPR